MSENSTTPNLVDVIRTAMRSYLVDLHTSLPAQIVSYDRNTQLAVVQPCLQRTLVDGQVIDLPKIYNVPVQFPSAGDMHIHFDLVKDDYVALVFSERSLDKWVTKGGRLAPADRRMHNINDCYAIAGVRPKPSSFTPKGASGSIEIRNKDTYLEITKEGKILVNNGQFELVSVLVELVTEMITGENLTGVGPLPKTPEFISVLEGIKTKLETFKQ